MIESSIARQSGSTSPFDKIREFHPNGSEYWAARTLQGQLGYEQWRQFDDCIDRAKHACANLGMNPPDHFADARKMIPIGKGGVRQVADYHLTRFACYLVAMNGDPRKPEIAAAQGYFAVQARKAETADQAVLDRLSALESFRAEWEARQLEPRPASTEGMTLKMAALALDPTRQILGEKRLLWFLRRHHLIQLDGAPAPSLVAQGWFTERTSDKLNSQGHFEPYREILITRLGLEQIRAFLINDGKLVTALPIRVMTVEPLLVNSEEQAWTEFLRRWYQTYGAKRVQCRDLIDLFVQDSVFADLVAGLGRDLCAQRLGYTIRRHMNTFIPGVKLSVKKIRSEKGSTYWLTLAR